MGILFNALTLAVFTYTKSRSCFQPLHLAPIFLLHTFQFHAILFLKVALAMLQGQILLLHSVPVRSNYGDFTVLLLVLFRE